MRKSASPIEKTVMEALFSVTANTAHSSLKPLGTARGSFHLTLCCPEESRPQLASAAVPRRLPRHQHCLSVSHSNTTYTSWYVLHTCAMRLEFEQKKPRASENGRHPCTEHLCYLSAAWPNTVSHRCSIISAWTATVSLLFGTAEIIIHEG